MANKIQKTVKWHIPKKLLIHFIEDNGPIEISGEVNVEKFVPGTVVEYTIKDKKVDSLNAVKTSDNSKKEEPKKEEEVKKNEPAEETKDQVEKMVVVIDKVAPSHEVVGWENSFKKWVPVAKELQFADHTPESEEAWKKQGLVARNEVELTLTNGVITAVKLIKTPTPSHESSDEQSANSKKSSSSTSYGRNDESIDKRTCIMCAKDISVALINNGKLDAKQINEAIEDLSICFYEILNKL